MGIGLRRPAAGSEAGREHSENRLASNWPMLQPWVGLAARVVLGAVWIWAAVSKLGDPRTFVEAVRAYDATPDWLARGIGYGLPVLELCLGVVLIVGVTVRIAAAVSALLLLVFLIGIIQAAARGLQLECGCFGGGGTTTAGTSYTWDIIRDLLLLAAAVLLVLWPMSKFSLQWFLARHDYVAPPSAKRLRTPEGRKRYEAQLAVKRAAARSRTLYLDSSIVLVVVLISLIGIGVQANRAKINGVIVGVNATEANGVTFGKAAAATVDVYEDFGCPVCEAFEKSTHVQLEKDVRANLAQVHYHTISFLDRNSPNQYSTRAANAAICVSDVSVDDFIRFHDILYGTNPLTGKQTQPVEGTAGPGNTDLITFGKKAGVTGSKISTFSDCVTSLEYKPLVQKLTDNSTIAGVSGTPTVFVNGKKLVNNDASSLFGAIATANKGHTPHPVGDAVAHRFAVCVAVGDGLALGVSVAVRVGVLRRRPRRRRRRRPRRSLRRSRRARRPRRRRDRRRNTAEHERRARSVCCGPFVVVLRSYLLAASLSAEPAVNLTVFAAGMVMVWPVAGLRPSRASRRPTLSAKKPGTLTFSPLAAAPSRVDCSARRTASTVFCSRSAASATAVTSSLRFTGSPLIVGVLLGSTGPSIPDGAPGPVNRGVLGPACRKPRPIR